MADALLSDTSLEAIGIRAEELHEITNNVQCELRHLRPNPCNLRKLLKQLADLASRTAESV